MITSDNFPRRPAVELLAASFIILFQELALIRWLPSQVRVLAYFPNVVLISAFLGLGIGCLLPAHRRVSAWWPAGLLLAIVTGVTLGRFAFTHEAPGEHFWLFYFDLPNAPVVQGIRLPILLAFLASAISFVPLGQFVAVRLQHFRTQGRALNGYLFDLLGSLLGVIAFAVASFYRTFPVLWFAVIAVAAVIFVATTLRQRIVWTVLLAASLLVVFEAESARYYSPYYALKMVPKRNGFLVLANGSSHQFANRLAMSDKNAESWLRRGYRIPYEAADTKLDRVLILGAGTGNDVAVALDAGAKHIDAVEIDPVILDLGRWFHPNRPYASPRVRAINGDARTFLNAPGEKYDLIVFGTLDSMTRLSALSNVRLDNFVYTAECFSAAARRLAPGGGIAIYFDVNRAYIENYIMVMLTQATGALPQVVIGEFEMFNRVFLAGPAFARLQRTPVTAAKIEEIRKVEAPTDDWPYLYMEQRMVSPFYLSMIATILIVSVISVAAVSPHMRDAFRRRGGFDAEMFLFGMSFLLLETKSVTEMSLVWGATWLTSAVVFGSILATILVATLVTRTFGASWRVGAIGLVVALAASYLVPLQIALTMNAPLRLVISAAFVGGPIFFAALAFAALFADRESADRAFGWNLLGAVTGGLLEFSSMFLGIRSLALIALVGYLLAFAIAYRRNAPATAPQEAN